MSGELINLANLDALVDHLRGLNKKYVLIFGYNGTGKTRLSMDFRQAGKNFDAEGNVTHRDTLYFNAFTEDLFYWDNDLTNDSQRVLMLNKESRFFNGLQELEMDNKVRPLIHRYFDFNFKINYELGSVTFERQELIGGTAQIIENIKVSRGEENIFIWCFFLAIAQLAVDRQEAYNWVNYIYIDDPVSSLDDNNVIAIAHHLASILKSGDGEVKSIISTHHALFFNVLHNELSNRMPKYFLSKIGDGYTLKNTNDSPFFYHVSLLKELQKAIDSGDLYTYHFNVLRTILEKAANFHGFNGFSDCLEVNDDDEDRTLHARMVNIFNHGSYSLFEPMEMGEENKVYFKQIFDNFLDNYKFNEDLFEETDTTEIA
jgi:hypothetical protein